MKALLFASMSVTAFALSNSLLADDIDWEDLNGQSKTVSSFDYTDKTVSYKNGTFNCNAGTAWFKNSTLNVGENLVFNFNGALSGANTTGGYELHIWNGGTLNIKSTVVHKQGIRLIVDEGGVLSTSLAKTFKETSPETVYKIDVAGTYNALAGIGTANGDSNWKTLIVYLKPTGVINLSGDLSQEGTKLAVVLEGGKLNVLVDSKAAGISSFTTADNSTVEIGVAENCTAAYGNLKCGAETTITKTGKGALSLGNNISSVEVVDGALLLDVAGAYDLSQVGFSEQGTLKIGAVGISITKYDSSLLSTTKLMLDSSLIAAGVTALTGPEGDTEFTEWAVKAINACIADGFEVVADGASIKVQKAFVKKTATWTGEGDDENWSTDENWGSGKPATGDDLEFGEATKTTATDDIAGLTVSKLAFSQEAPAYTINGEQQLTVLEQIVNESAATQTLNLPVGLSGLSFELNTVGDIVFKTLSSSGTPLTKKGEGMATFSEGFAGPLAIAEGGVKVANGKKLAETAGAVTINGTLDLDGGTLSIVQPDSEIASIGDGAVLKNGTFNHSSEKLVYLTNEKTGSAFMWTNGTWTIAKGATVITSGYLFEFGPDAPAASYGERRIVVDGGELRSTAKDKYVIGVNDDFAKPAVIELKNGALLKTTASGEFHIGARNSGIGSSTKAKGVVIANDSTIELADQLRILNETQVSNSSGILAMTNSTLRLPFLGTTQWNDHHQLNASGYAWTDAQMILNHTEASFYRLLAKARVGSGISAGKMVGVLTLDGATLKPIKATDTFIYNDQPATKTIELLTDGATIDTDYDITIPAIAYGVGGLTKKGAGTLTLSAANTYTGATTVEEGTLKLTGSVAGSLVIGENGTLEVPIVEGAPVVGAAASLEFKEGAKLKIDLTGLDLTKKQPFLTLPTEGTLVGEPTLEIAGLEGGRWKVVARKTQDGVVCSVAQATGLIITIE